MPIMLYVGPPLEKIGGISVFLKRRLESEPSARYIGFERNISGILIVLFRVFFHLLRGDQVEWHRSRFRCGILMVLCFSSNFKFVFHHGSFDSRLHRKIGALICRFSEQISRRFYFVSREMANDIEINNHYDITTVSKVIKRIKGNNYGIIWSGQCLEIYDPLTVVQAFTCLLRERSDLIKIVGGLDMYLYGEVNESLFSQIEQIATGDTQINIHFGVPENVFTNALSHSWAYIRTSKVDSHCVALHDALSMGQVVIASDIPGRPKGCILFNKGNWVALSDTIAKEAEKK